MRSTVAFRRHKLNERHTHLDWGKKLLGARQNRELRKKERSRTWEDLKLANKRAHSCLSVRRCHRWRRWLNYSHPPPLARPFALSGLRARDICSRGYFAYISTETDAHRRTQHHGVSRQMYFWAAADLLFTRATLKTQLQYLTGAYAG